ncbi:ABC transporter substrate-binding protein [Simiduia aestuariiviva]|uniref:NitT/TauT family transport system substrate-binding protein n=1 Tax=Simiduia aestuariiviva TaxID=1510459 RepID=A0A839UHM1_9GAMM|nr:NitT/TauT family transport system substrate-binding protein [Simiduia aestuariiviva]
MSKQPSRPDQRISPRNHKSTLKRLTQALLVGFSLTTLTALVTATSVAASQSATPSGRTPITAAYIPLADHYAAIIAYERYSPQMQRATFQIRQMKNWNLLRAHFREGQSDLAFVMAPLAMAMFQEDSNFRWVGLMHRDGNALAINDVMASWIDLPTQREARKPKAQLAHSIQRYRQSTGRAIPVAVPHLQSTHAVALYQYLKSQGLTLAITPNVNAPVQVRPLAPPKSPLFLREKSQRQQPAAFEQSLPFADVVETEGFGKIAWYSKDVLPWPKGHVECIAVASDQALNEKLAAIREVMHYIQRAAQDIESARQQGGAAMESIITDIRKHIPAHSPAAITASLNPNLAVINYNHLDIDKPGLKYIMDLAVEAGILTHEIDIDAFAIQLGTVPSEGEVGDGD